MTEYFYKLSQKSHILPSIQEEIKNRKDWFDSNGFKILKLPVTLFKQSHILDTIIQFNGTPLIFKLDPMTWYDWHIDEHRYCSINMHIEGTKSKCFFGARENRDIVKLTELSYEPDTFYLLNTREKHAVLNLENTRYMLSIGFNQPCTYQILLDHIIKKTL